MVNYQPAFLICLAYLSHVVSGVAVINKDQLDNPVRPDSSKIDVPRNLLKRGGGGDGGKGYGRWDVDKKSQNDGHGYDDYDGNDNEWDHEWYNKFGESSDEQVRNWREKEGWNMDWVNELFNNANNAPDTTTITAIATTTVDTATTTTAATTTSISISAAFGITTVPVTSIETETITDTTIITLANIASVTLPEVTVTSYTPIPCISEETVA